MGALVAPTGYVTKGIKGGTLASTLDSKLLDGSLARRLTVDGGVDRGRIAVKLATGGSAPRHYIGEARSAGQAYQLWRVQQQSDIEFSALDAADQQRLAQLLSEGGTSRAQYLSRLDGETVDDLLSVRCGAVSTTAVDACPRIGSVIDSLERADLSDVEQDRLVSRLFGSDAPENGDDQLRLLRAISEGGPNGAKIVANVDDVTDIADYVERTGNDGLSLIRRFKDPENAANLVGLDVSRADEVQVNLAKYSGDPLFSSSQAEQFISDTYRLKKNGEYVEGFEDGPIAMIADAGQASDLRGAAYEARVAGTYGPDQIERMAFDVERSDGSQLTEVDIELTNGDIIEAKSSLSGQQTDLETKVRSLVQSGKLNDGQNYIIRSTENPSDNLDGYMNTVEGDINSQGISINIQFKRTTRIGAN